VWWRLILIFVILVGLGFLFDIIPDLVNRLVITLIILSTLILIA